MSEGNLRKDGGVPDGHLESGSRNIFDRMHLPYPDKKNYVIEFIYPLNGTDIPISAGLRRPEDIVRRVQGINGSGPKLVFGIAGLDNLYEVLGLHLNGDPIKSLDQHLEKEGIVRLVDLGFRPSHLVLAVHKDLVESGIYNFEQFKERYSLDGKGEKIRVGSEFSHITRDFMEKYNINYVFYKTVGKTETDLKQGLVDAIIDVAETGGRIIENDGIFFTDPSVLESSTPQLFTSQEACDRYPEFIEDLKRKTIEARDMYRKDTKRAFHDRFPKGVKRQREVLEGYGIV